MPPAKHRFRMYRRMLDDAPEILEEARRVAHEMGLTEALPTASGRGTAAHGGSGLGTILRPGATRSGTRSEEQSGSRIPSEEILVQIREVVKDAYGDSYDCLPVSSPASALSLAFQAAMGAKVPWQRPRCIVPRQKALNPLKTLSLLPPKYRHLFDRSSQPASRTRREQGVEQGGEQRMDAVMVPLQGAVYENHGPGSWPVSLLTGVHPESSLEALAATAEVHGAFLAGFFAQGTSTPGCGFGPRDDDGVHLLHRGLGELASEFDVPLVMDETFGLPFLSKIPRVPCSSATVYGHPAMGGLGLIIGTEDLVTPAAREAARANPSPENAVRQGVTNAVNVESSRLSLLLDLMRDLSTYPERYTRAVDRLYDVVTEVFSDLDEEFKQELRIRKEPASLSVEVNYEDTWKDRPGFPIFSMRDSECGCNLLQAGLAAMEISSASVLEASVTIGPAVGPSHPEFSLERISPEVRGLARFMQILGRHAGYLEK